MGHHLPHLGSYGGNDPEVLRLGGMCLPIRGSGHAHTSRRHPTLGFRRAYLTTARALLILIACKLKQFLQNPPPDHKVDMETLSDLGDSFSFREIRKRILHSPFCAVL